MNSDDGNLADQTDESDLIAICRGLRRYRALIISATIFGGLLAVILALLADTVFRAEVTITPVREEGMNGTGALSQLNGLASLAGVNLGSGAGPQKESLAVLKSRYLIQEFIQRNDLLPLLFRGSTKPHTLWRGVRHFQAGILNIREDIRQNLTIVAIEWTDPATAAQWANGFVALANELLRNRALEESKRNITYLNDQVSKTDAVELRRVLYTLIENETKTLMLANGRPEYAFTVVDPAVPPELRSGPHRSIMVLVGLSLGFIVGALVAMVHSKIGRIRRRLSQVD